MLVAVTFAGLGFYAFKYGAQYVWQRDEEIRQNVRDNEFAPLLNDYQDRINDLVTDQKYLRERLHTAEQERSSLIQVSQTSRFLAEQQQQQDRAWHDMELQSTVKALRGEIQEYQRQQGQYVKGIQDVSRVALLDKFGPGPYFVKVTLAFPGDDPHVETSSLLLEMASAADMPHTVYTFLSRVSKGLYDGTSFYHNAGHVLVAGALPNLNTPDEHAKDLLHRFDKSGLRQTSFQEYSTQWPHTKFTVGLAGRPAGTDFYINMQDNTAVHGPGGQTKYHDGATTADPCFAKVVRGFDSITRMQASISGSADLERRISILEAHIV